MKKPFIKRHIYTVILMRDDGGVRNFRIKNTTLRLFCTLFVLLLLAGTGGIIVGAHYWDSVQEYKASKVEFAETKAKLDQFIQFTSFERLAEVGTHPIPIAIDETVSAGPDTSPPVQEAEPARDFESATQQDTLHKEGSSHNATQAREANATSAPLENGLSLPKVASQESPIRINNMTTQIQAGNSLQVRYEMLSHPQDSTVKGTVSYAATLKDGKSIDLVINNAEDTSFIISRMKVFDFIVSLPEDIPSHEVETITITVTIDDGSSFQSSFPVTRQ